jgi:hypothetical protein
VLLLLIAACGGATGVDVSPRLDFAITKTRFYYVVPEVQPSISLPSGGVVGIEGQFRTGTAGYSFSAELVEVNPDPSQPGGWEVRVVGSTQGRTVLSIGTTHDFIATVSGLDAGPQTIRVSLTTDAIGDVVVLDTIVAVLPN